MVRSPRGRYPSSSGPPTGSPAARRDARFATTGATVFIAATVGSVFVLRRRDPMFHVPGYPWTPLAFLAMVAALLALLGLYTTLQALLGLSLVAAALPVYQLIGGSRRAEEVEKTTYDRDSRDSLR